MDPWSSGLYAGVLFFIFFVCVHAQLLQSCPTLWDPRDCSPPGSSVRGILRARILEWVAISSYRGSSRPRALTRIFCVSCIGRQILYHCATFTAEGLSIILVWGTNIPSSHVPWQKNKNQKKLLPSLGPQGAHVWPDGDLLNWSPVGHVDYL